MAAYQENFRVSHVSPCANCRCGINAFSRCRQPPVPATAFVNVPQPRGNRTTFASRCPESGTGVAPSPSRRCGGFSLE